MTIDRLQVKICCIASIAEAELAIECGADLLGLVSAMPSGPGVIADDDISRIRESVQGRAKTVLLTSRASVDGIGEQVRLHRPDVVQFCDTIASDQLSRVRELHPNIALMPVIHVRDGRSIAEAVAIAEHADAVLLDSGNPDASIKELGGTGRVHDWKLSRAIRDAIGTPVFLAGGLRPENIGAAVRAVRPTGVDVCSGVREQGLLIRSRLKAFIQRARET